MYTLPIEKMSTTDRIQAMEELWDALSHEQNEIESPDWHKKVLSDRTDRIKSGDAVYLTIDELKKKLNK